MPHNQEEEERVKESAAVEHPLAKHQTGSNDEEQNRKDKKTNWTLWQPLKFRWPIKDIEAIRADRRGREVAPARRARRK